MQGQSSENFYSSSRFYGGIAIGYTALTEADFSLPNGSAYSPPEVGDFRRINVSRAIQLVSDCSSIIETFQTSASEIRVPASSASNEDIDDAGPGRFIIIKNQGTGTITIKDYLGVTITTILSGCVSILSCDDNNNWDYYFRANQVPHELITAMETSSTVQTSLEYLMRLFRDVIKEPTGYVNKYVDSILTFNNGSRTVSIAPRTPTYTSFDYYIRGKIYTVTTTHSYQITDTEGLWYFYFDQNGVFQGSQTPWSLTTPIAVTTTAYWDQDNNIFITTNEERHGCTMDFDTHRRLHLVDGAQIQTVLPKGLEITNTITNGDGSLNSHAQYAITNGVYFDEDISIEIKHANPPINEYEQILNPIAYIPVFYLLGVDNWRKKTATVYPFCENPPNLPYYNLYSSGTWSLASTTSNYFFATFLAYSDSLTEPVISILGQRQDTNLIDSVNNNTISGLQLPRKFTEEVYFYKKLIWEVSTSFTNTPKCRLRYIALQTETNAANDRYAAICNYNGNAGIGKYLDFFPGQSSVLSPYPIPEPSFIKTVTLTAVANSTGTVSIYKSTDLVNAIATVSLSNSVYVKVSFALVLNADDKLTTKVSAGSINKPAMTIFIQTNL